MAKTFKGSFGTLLVDPRMQENERLVSKTQQTSTLSQKTFESQIHFYVKGVIIH